MRSLTTVLPSLVEWNAAGSVAAGFSGSESSTIGARRTLLTAIRRLHRPLRSNIPVVRIGIPHPWETRAVVKIAAAGQSSSTVSRLLSDILSSKDHVHHPRHAVGDAGPVGSVPCPPNFWSLARPASALELIFACQGGTCPRRCGLLDQIDWRFREAFSTDRQKSGYFLSSCASARPIPHGIAAATQWQTDELL